MPQIVFEVAAGRVSEAGMEPILQAAQDCAPRDANAASSNAQSYGSLAAVMNKRSPSSHSFISQRLRLHYADWGNPTAPLLLLIHGGRDHCRSWDWVASELCADWHVVAPDLRGHGDSSWSSDGNYDLIALVYDLAQLVRQLGQTPLSIVGHSLGGNVALRFTGLYPHMVRRLVSIEGLGFSPAMESERAATPLAEQWRKWIADKREAATRQPRRYSSIGEALGRMRAENAWLTEEQALHLTLHGLNRNEDDSWSWKFDPHMHVWPFLDIPRSELRALWSAIRCPTLLMYGTDSWESEPQSDGRASHFADARVVEFVGAGHWLHHEQCDRFLAELRAFL